MKTHSPIAAIARRLLQYLPAIVATMMFAGCCCGIPMAPTPQQNAPVAGAPAAAKDQGDRTAIEKRALAAGTTGAELGNYQQRVMKSARGQKFEPLMTNVTCQLAGRGFDVAVRDLPDFLLVRVTTDDGGGYTEVILDRHSAVASLLGDAQPHRLVVEIGPATRQTLVDTVRLEIFSGREIKELPPLKRAVKVLVQANQPWQDTGIDVPAGSEVTAEVTGTWAKGKAVCGGGGFADKDTPEPESLRLAREEMQRVAKESPPFTGLELTKLMQQSKKDAKSFQALLQAQKEQKEWEPAHRKRLSAASTKVVSEKDAHDKSFVARRFSPGPFMALLMRIGEGGVDLLPPRFPPSAQSGRLFLRPNCAVLTENNGTLEVEIAFITRQFAEK